jgi:hypothetical protein
MFQVWAGPICGPSGTKPHEVPPRTLGVRFVGALGRGASAPLQLAPDRDRVNQPIHQPGNQPTGFWADPLATENPCQHWAGSDLGEEAG